MIDETLAEIERDAAPDAGAQFVQLAADYLAENGAGGVPVWPAASAEELAARFAGPLPSGGSTLAEVIARLREDVMPTAIRLSHPMYMGHQVSAPLPVAVWTE